MPNTAIRLAAALLMPLLLASCVLAPGKFVSTLIINADRSFSFSYVGEVLMVDTDSAMSSDLMKFGDDTGGEADNSPAAVRERAEREKEAAERKAHKAREAEAAHRAMAEALSKEAGYRKVAYLGGGKFQVDYAITGTLTHGFVFPYNPDAMAIFPFVAVELRAGGNVRVSAPAFGNDDKGAGALSGGGMGGALGGALGGTMGGGGAAPQQALDGIFTLDTDAEIISQNNEDGASLNGTRRVIRWKATPATRAAPMAVLRLAR